MQIRRYNAPYRGPMSSEQLNTMQLEIISDISNLAHKFNEMIKLSSIQEGDLTPIPIYYGNSILNTYVQDSMNHIVTDLAHMTYTQEHNNISK